MPAVIFAFCAVVVFFALQLDTALAIVIVEAMQPRSFPIFLMALIALLNALLVYQLVNGSWLPRPRQSPQTWITMLLMIVFYGLTTYVDMFVGLLVVIFAMSLAWGSRVVVWRHWSLSSRQLTFSSCLIWCLRSASRVEFSRNFITDNRQ